MVIPGTPSSIPVIIAAQKTGNTEIKVAHNLAQTHAAFIKGDADLILTGLSVGMGFLDREIPVKFITSHVSSLSWLVYNQEAVGKLNSFSDLVGKKIFFPFPGSPLEEICRYFARQEGLELGKDIETGYLSFQSSIQMLQQQKIEVAALPEPFVSLVLSQSQHIKPAIQFSTLWETYNQSTYPQVVVLTKPDWFEANEKWVDEFIVHLQEATALCTTDPEQAVALTKNHFKLPEKILLSALKGTKFDIKTDSELRDSVFSYYQEIGKDVKTEYEQFF